jgi:hypothetical protein
MEWFYTRDTKESPNGLCFCNGCFDETHVKCEVCEEYHHEDDIEEVKACDECR